MKKLITPLAFALIVITFGFGWNHFSLLKKIELNFGKEGKGENEEDEARDAQGMRDMFGKIRNNQVTGTINLNDFYKAQYDAKQYAAAGDRGLNLAWQNMGPDNQGGRSLALLIDPKNPNHLFCGAASGGLWVSNDAGVTWNTVPGSDQQSSLIISCIAEAGNGAIYYGTGEYFGFNPGDAGEEVTGSNGFPGGGIWASHDGGNTFTNIQTPSNNGSVGYAGAFSFYYLYGC